MSLALIKPDLLLPPLLASIGLGAVLTIGLRSWQSSARRWEADSCGTCGYSLRGLGAPLRCPECGAVRPGHRTSKPGAHVGLRLDPARGISFAVCGALVSLIGSLRPLLWSVQASWDTGSTFRMLSFLHEEAMDWSASLIGMTFPLWFFLAGVRNRLILRAVLSAALLGAWVIADTFTTPGSGRRLHIDGVAPVGVAIVVLLLGHVVALCVALLLDRGRVRVLATGDGGVVRTVLLKQRLGCSSGLSAGESG